MTLIAAMLTPLLLPNVAVVLFTGLAAVEVQWVLMPFTWMMNVVPCTPDVGVIFTPVGWTGRTLIASEAEAATSAFVIAVKPRKPMVAVYETATWQVR